MDVAESGSSPSLTDHLREAMDQSDALVVLCSENAVASSWVREEIEYFEKNHGRSSIFYIIDQKLGSENQNRGDLIPVVGDSKLNPALAADVQADGRKRAYAKILAGVFGQDFGIFWNNRKRDIRRKWRNRGFIALAGLSPVIAASILVISAMNLFSAVNSGVIASDPYGLSYLRVQHDELEIIDSNGNAVCHRILHGINDQPIEAVFSDSSYLIFQENTPETQSVSSVLRVTPLCQFFTYNLIAEGGPSSGFPRESGPPGDQNASAGLRAFLDHAGAARFVFSNRHGSVLYDLAADNTTCSALGCVVRGRPLQGVVRLGTLEYGMGHGSIGIEGVEARSFVARDGLLWHINWSTGNQVRVGSLFDAAQTYPQHFDIALSRLPENRFLFRDAWNRRLVVLAADGTVVDEFGGSAQGNEQPEPLAAYGDIVLYSRANSPDQIVARNIADGTERDQLSFAFNQHFNTALTMSAQQELSDLIFLEQDPEDLTRIELRFGAGDDACSLSTRALDYPFHIRPLVNRRLALGTMAGGDKIVDLSRCEVIRDRRADSLLASIAERMIVWLMQAEIAAQSQSPP